MYKHQCLLRYGWCLCYLCGCHSCQINLQFSVSKKCVPFSKIPVSLESPNEQSLLTAARPLSHWSAVNAWKSLGELTAKNPDYKVDRGGQLIGPSSPTHLSIKNLVQVLKMQRKGGGAPPSCMSYAWWWWSWWWWRGTSSINTGKSLNTNWQYTAPVSLLRKTTDLEELVSYEDLLWKQTAVLVWYPVKYKHCTYLGRYSCLNICLLGSFAHSGEHSTPLKPVTLSLKSTHTRACAHTHAHRVTK